MCAIQIRYFPLIFIDLTKRERERKLSEVQKVLNFQMCLLSRLSMEIDVGAAAFSTHPI